MLPSHRVQISITRKKDEVILRLYHNGTLYVGSTSDLIKRVWEHKNNVIPKRFTAQYNVHMLVYYEIHEADMEADRSKLKICAQIMIARAEKIYTLSPQSHVGSLEEKRIPKGCVKERTGLVVT